MSETSGGKTLQIPTRSERLGVESWHARISEGSRTEASATVYTALPLLLVVSLGRRSIAYCACAGSHELLAVVCSLCAHWAPADAVGELATEFCEDYFPNGYQAAISIDGPEFWAWMAYRNHVPKVPEDWGWTWRHQPKDLPVGRLAPDPNSPPF